MSFGWSSLGRAVIYLVPSLVGVSFAIGCDDVGAPDIEEALPDPPRAAQTIPATNASAKRAAGPETCVVEDQVGSCRLERCGLSRPFDVRPRDDAEPPDGGDVEPLLSELEAPPLPVVTAPAEDLGAHPRSRDLVVAWQDTPGDAVVRVLLTNEPDVIAKTNAGRRPRFVYSVTCDAPVEDGAVTIPSSLLSAFPETELDPALRVVARQSYTIEEDGSDVTFTVGWFALSRSGRDFDRTLKLD